MPRIKFKKFSLVAMRFDKRKDKISMLPVNTIKELSMSYLVSSDLLNSTISKLSPLQLFINFFHKIKQLIARKYSKQKTWTLPQLWMDVAPGQCFRPFGNCYSQLLHKKWYDSFSSTPVLPWFGSCRLFLFPKLKGRKFDTIEGMKQKSLQELQRI